MGLPPCGGCVPTLNRRALAGHDDGLAGGRFGQPGQVGGITGEDPVAGSGQERHGSVDRVSRACHAKQDACVTATLVTNGADINGSVKYTEVRLQMRSGS